MNNAKMWLVVKPTVGVPLFLSAVAVGSFAVHYAVLSHTTWVTNFLQGKPMAQAALAVPEKSALVKFEGTDDATVILPDGRKGKVVFAPLPSDKSTQTAMVGTIIAPDK
jgi:light-harvesting protein B-800-850 alpha chain